MVEGEGQSQNINSLTKIDKKCVYIYIYVEKMYLQVDIDISIMDLF